MIQLNRRYGCNRITHIDKFFHNSPRCTRRRGHSSFEGMCCATTSPVHSVFRIKSSRIFIPIRIRSSRPCASGLDVQPDFIVISAVCTRQFRFCGSGAPLRGKSPGTPDTHKQMLLFLRGRSHPAGDVRHRIDGKR